MSAWITRHATATLSALSLLPVVALCTWVVAEDAGSDSGSVGSGSAIDASRAGARPSPATIRAGQLAQALHVALEVRDATGRALSSSPEELLRSGSAPLGGPGPGPASVRLTNGGWDIVVDGDRDPASGVRYRRRDDNLRVQCWGALVVPCERPLLPGRPTG